MIRGVPLSYVLEDSAAVLSLQERVGQYDDSGGADANLPFSHSVARERLDAFLSHSWRDSRLLKYLVFLFANNHLLAVIVATLATASATGLALEAMDYKLEPRFTICGEFADYGADVGQFCSSNGPADLAFLAVYVLIFFTGHLVQSEKHIFLDVACIDQSNDEKKVAGIRSLGAVASSSDKLLVCASFGYFERL